MLSASHFWIVLTALLWGATDPLLKHFGAIAEEENKKKQQAAIGGGRGGPFSDLVGFFSDWRYSAAFVCNQASEEVRGEAN